jgi:vacuolar-type H+-ATPase subunit I/STV1
MELALVFARSSLPSMQTIFVIAGIIAVIGGVLYSRMSMS